MGRRDSRRWSGARRTSLCRSGQAEQSGCAVHLSHRRSQPVQPRLERGDGASRRIATHAFGITEGRTMILLGKLSWGAITLNQPIVAVSSALMAFAAIFVLAWREK